MYIGVDVGTGSARACLMDEQGTIRAMESKHTKRYEPEIKFVNQSTTDIWDAICHCTKTILKLAKIDKNEIKGIAFDATCSLAVVDKDLEPIAVGPDFANNDQNVILWMDHRAPEETDLIASTKHTVLKYVGGKMSIEMEVPKMLWLKNNMPAELFDRCEFYDLADYLTDRATDTRARSLNSTTCKQGYLPQGVDGSKDGWSKDFLEQIGLGDLVKDDFKRLGGINGKNGSFYHPGQRVGTLSAKSAEELGLSEKTIVASGVIDAYAGWIGTVAAKTDEALPHKPIEGRLAAVAGTSTCHIVLSQNAVFVDGVWGPYRDALIPGMWAAEGGQSTTGELLHYILRTHPAYTELLETAEKARRSTFEVLNDILEESVEKSDGKIEHVSQLIQDLFVYGDFYGNRSPIADPHMRGSITGLNMDNSLHNLALLYLGTVEFICLQTRQIIEAMNNAGHKVESIYLSGGQCRNRILTGLLATCTSKPVVIPRYIDAAVVLGSAIIASSGANDISLWDAMSKHSGTGSVIMPNKDKVLNAVLSAKYKVLLDQAERQRYYRKLVSDAVSQASK